MILSVEGNSKAGEFELCVLTHRRMLPHLIDSSLNLKVRRAQKKVSSAKLLYGDADGDYKYVSESRVRELDFGNFAQHEGAAYHEFLQVFL